MGAGVRPAQGGWRLTPPAARVPAAATAGPAATVRWGRLLRWRLTLDSTATTAPVPTITTAIPMGTAVSTAVP